MKIRTWIKIILGLAAGGSAMFALSIALTGRVWDGETFHISTGDLTLTQPSANTWETAFNTAATRWNTSVPFVVTTDGANQQLSCGSDDTNTAFFSSTSCGNPWQGSTVGVSRTWSSSRWKTMPRTFTA